MFWVDVVMEGEGGEGRRHRRERVVNEEDGE
jgi:hypothetical protein